MMAVSLIIVTGLAAAALCRKRSAAVRHWILATAVGCAAISPLLTLIAPAWRYRPPGNGAPSTASTMRQIPTPDAVSIEIRGSTTAAQPPISEPVRASVASLAMPLWFGGAGLSLAVLMLGFGRLRWLAARSQSVTHGPWRDMADAVANEHRVRRRVVLLQSTHPSLLVTWGFWRPRIILPAAAPEWPPARIRLVLAHEMAHIARADWLTQLMAEGLRAVYWFNPLMWLACRRLRYESEQACDDIVLNGGVAGTDYATLLIDLARAARDQGRYAIPAAPAPAMVRPSSLERRVRAMLNTERNRNPAGRLARAIVTSTLLTVSLLIAGFGAAAQSLASLSGTISDPHHGVVPGVSVILTNSRDQTKREVTSNEAGQFHVADLPPGNYVIEARSMGFQPVRRNLTVGRSNVRHDIAMPIGSLTETVTIAAVAGVRAPSDHVPAAKIEPDLRPQQECRTSAGGDIRPPRKIKHANPVYPDNPDGSIAGVVVVEGRIGTDGTISQVKVLRSPHANLSRAATEAFEQWVFTPTLLNCVPIAVSITATMNFAVE